MSVRKNNPIYIIEKVIANNFPSTTPGWANYVTGEIINALNVKGFDISKIEQQLNNEVETKTNIYYVSEQFCYHEDENIPDDLFWSATGTKQIHACNKKEAREIYNQSI